MVALALADQPPIDLEPLARLGRDLKAATATLSAREARYLVDLYYLTQEDRIRAGNQVRALGENEEPHAVIGWVHDQTETLEHDIRTALDRWTQTQKPGRWLKSVTGIGPVISAGILAHVDITQAPTAGHIWRFAGLDPTVAWGKGQKRPWNAALKVVCYKAGESFVKVQNNQNDVYGHIFAERRKQEGERNERGDFADQAASALAAKKYGKDTNAYKAYQAGKLPDAHLHARARRYCVKIWLSHAHHVLYECHYGEPPPKPYILTQEGHAHYLKPPNWPFEG